MTPAPVSSCSWWTPAATTRCWAGPCPPPACRTAPLRGRAVTVDSMPLPPRGTAALFSCKSGERAFETDKLGGGHGVFFYYVIKGLESEARNRRGEVTWGSLADYVTEKVSDQVPVVI